MTIECPACGSRYDAGARPVGTQIHCRCGAAFAVRAPSAPVESLTCPRCGGPCGPDSASCAYCGTALAAATCPHCLGRVFQGSPHCPHCGTDMTATAGDAGTGTPRDCPRCTPTARRLVAHVVDGTILDECPGCGGVWIDTVAFTKLVADRERQAAVLTEEPAPLQIDGTGAGAADALTQVRYLSCPDCHVLMNRQNFGRRSGVIVDVCKPHGTWFDRDELRRVVKFVMDGGLEETKRRQLAELTHELETKRDAASADAVDPPIFTGQVVGWGRHRSGLLDLLLGLFD